MALIFSECFAGHILCAIPLLPLPQLSFIPSFRNYSTFPLRGEGPGERFLWTGNHDSVIGFSRWGW